MDDRFEVWLYLSDSLDLIEDGYGPLDDRFVGLSRETFEEFFMKEVLRFLNTYR